MYRELFYISNILSLSRIILVIPVYYCLKIESTAGNLWAVFFMLLACLTDSFDGRLARRLHQQSDLGRILDPLADKIAVGILAILLVSLRDLPLWFVILVIARDLLILFAGLFIMYRTKHVVESNQLGKMTVTALAVLIIAYTLQAPEALRLFFLWASVGFLLVSAIVYAVTMQSPGKPSGSD